MAQRIIEHGEAHYESREVPFGKVYEWNPAHITLECDCGEKLALTANSTMTTCGCGAEVGGFIQNIEEREGHLPDNLTHPWYHDAQVQAQQHSRDEAAYPEGSPWRYNDITSDDKG